MTTSFRTPNSAHTVRIARKIVRIECRFVIPAIVLSAVWLLVLAFIVAPSTTDAGGLLLCALGALATVPVFTAVAAFGRAWALSRFPEELVPSQQQKQWWGMSVVICLASFCLPFAMFLGMGMLSAAG